MIKRKIFILTIGIIAVFSGCSPSSRTTREYISPKKYPIVKNIDSSTVAAAVKPYNYRWNTEGHLTDLIRKRYKPPDTSPKYPNPFSPHTHIPLSILKSDTVKFYLCNEDESICYKFQEGYFEKGVYSIGFQKLNFEPWVFLIKMETPDTTYSKKYVVIP